MTTSPGNARRHKTVTRAPQALHAVPVRTDDAGGSTVIRIPLTPSGSEWALVVAPPGMHVLRLAPLCPTGPYIHPLPGQFTLVRVPDLAELNLGLATLLYRRGQATTYCVGNQITSYAACVLPALAGQAVDSALAGQAVRETADLDPRITVTPVGHYLLPAGLHPAAALADGQAVNIFACSDLITPRLSEVLSILWTTHTRYLLHLGRPRTQARPAGPVPVPVQLAADSRAVATR